MNTDSLVIVLAFALVNLSGVIFLFSEDVVVKFLGICFIVLPYVVFIITRIEERQKGEIYDS